MQFGETDGHRLIIPVHRPFVFELFPLHGLAEGLDAEDDFAVLKNSNGAARLADDDADGMRRFADGRAGPVPSPEPLRHREIGVGSIDELSLFLDESFGRNNKGAVEHGDLLDCFAYAGVVQVALGAGIATDRIETGRLAVGENLAGVAHDEHGADGFPFATFAADFDGEINNHLERIERDAGFELTQIASGEFAQVFIEADEADRVDGVGIKTGIGNDGARPRREDIARHTSQQGLSQPFVDRSLGHIKQNGFQPGFAGPGDFLFFIGRNHDSQPVENFLEFLPISRPREQQKQSHSLLLPAEVGCQSQELGQLIVEFDGLHAGDQGPEWCWLKCNATRSRGDGGMLSNLAGKSNRGAADSRDFVKRFSDSPAREKCGECSQQFFLGGSTMFQPDLSRRRFLTLSSAAVAGSTAVAAANQTLVGQQPEVKAAADPQNYKPLRVAAINSIFRLRSHAYHIIGRLVHGYPVDGFHHQPNVQVMRMFNDQSPADDLSDGFCRDHGIRLCKTVEETLLTEGELDIDGVVLIIEHGDYPINERKQVLYPRHKYFQEIVKAFRRAGRSVPVFVDKHLSYDHEHAAEMVQTAKDMKFGLMAGSSLPVTWRMPEIEPPLGTKFSEGLCVFGFDRGVPEIYFFHALETLQCMLERRAGGETGVKNVSWLQGDDVWKAGDAGRWSWKLLDLALRRCSSFNVGPLKENVRNPQAILVEYNDGTRGAALNLVEQVSEFGFAGQVKDVAEPISSCFYLPAPPGAAFFNPLTWHIEGFLRTGTPQYPVERTQLTSTMLDFACRAAAEKRGTITNPALNIRYQPPAASGFFRGPIVNLS